MTLTEAKNSIIIYLLKNKEASVLSIKDIPQLGISGESDEATAAFLAAIGELETIGLFKKQTVSKDGVNSDFWVLSNPLDKQDKTIEVSYEVVDAVAKTIEQYESATGKKNFKVDRTNFSENEIGHLLYIISDILNSQKND